MAEATTPVVDLVLGGTPEQRDTYCDMLAELVVVLVEDTLKEHGLIKRRLLSVDAPPGAAKDAPNFMRYAGVWEAGRSYKSGECVTFRGSLWHANRTTTEEPGKTDAFTLAVKKGRDARRTTTTHSEEEDQ